jgi:hypothetical protein
MLLTTRAPPVHVMATVRSRDLGDRPRPGASMRRARHARLFTRRLTHVEDHEVAIGAAGGRPWAADVCGIRPQTAGAHRACRRRPSHHHRARPGQGGDRPGDIGLARRATRVAWTTNQETCPANWCASATFRLPARAGAERPWVTGVDEIAPADSRSLRSPGRAERCRMMRHRYLQVGERSRAVSITKGPAAASGAPQDRDIVTTGPPRSRAHRCPR